MITAKELEENNFKKWIGYWFVKKDNISFEINLMSSTFRHTTSPKFSLKFKEETNIQDVLDLERCLSKFNLEFDFTIESEGR